MVFTVGGDWGVWTLLFFRIHTRVERLLVRSLHFNACTRLIHFLSVHLHLHRQWITSEVRVQSSD